ncbi:MAG: Spy/CpxP family protein refolding chaperone [Myxococcota bacterium]
MSRTSPVVGIGSVERQTRSRLVALITLLCAWFPIAALADPGQHRPPGSFAALYAERLGLDAEAQAGIQEIVARSGVRNEALWEEVRAAKQRLRDLMNESHHPDEAAVLALAEAIGTAEAEVHKNRLRAILAIRELLTPEQRREMLRMRDEEYPRRSGSRSALGACERDRWVHCREQSGRAALGCLHEAWEELSEPCRHAFDAPQAPGAKAPDAP